MLSTLVAAIGLACAVVGLGARDRWPALIGVVVNSSAVVVAFLVRLAVEHDFGA